MYTSPQYTTANPNRCPSNANDIILEQHPLHERRRRASVGGSSAFTSVERGHRDRRTSMSQKVSTRRDGSQCSKFGNGAERCAVAEGSSNTAIGDCGSQDDDNDDENHDDSIPIAVTNHSFSTRKCEAVIEEGQNDHVSVANFGFYAPVSIYECCFFNGTQLCAGFLTIFSKSNAEQERLSCYSNVYWLCVDTQSHGLQVHFPFSTIEYLNLNSRTKFSSYNMSEDMRGYS